VGCTYRGVGTRAVSRCGLLALALLASAAPVAAGTGEQLAVHGDNSAGQEAPVDDVLAADPPKQAEFLAQERASVIPGRYIVVLRNSASALATLSRVNLKGMKIDHVYQDALQGFAGTLSPTAVDLFEQNPDVVEVEPDRLVRVDSYQPRVAGNQPGATWGLDRIDQRSLPLDNVYRYNTTAPHVTAYVIDTGIRGDHVEFGGRVRAGYDAVGGISPPTYDCAGHGTRVAGTIGGATYGVAKRVELVAVRVFGCTGRGRTSGIIAGIDWVTADHRAGSPAVANMSISRPHSYAMDLAVNRSIRNGITYAVAAGNDDVDACDYSPADVGAAITVGAVDSSDRRADFPIWGSDYGRCVDIFAPGVDIESAGHTSSTVMATMSGTSTASPHVAGVAALLLARRPSGRPAALARTLKSIATANAVLSPGDGSPNLLAYSDLSVLSPPGAPRSVEALPGRSQATVRWLPPRGGDLSITRYRVTASPGGRGVVVDGRSRVATVTGLRNGVHYTLSVRAINWSGAGPRSNRSNSVRPSNPSYPGIPTRVSVAAGDGRAVVRWRAPQSAGGSRITAYRVLASPGREAVRVSGGARRETITGLANFRSYGFAVAAVNAHGSSFFSDPPKRAMPAYDNDRFANAQRVRGLAGTTPGTNVGAGKQRGEPNHAGMPGGASVWYVWRAPARGVYVFETAGSGFDTLLAVYRGSDVGSLNPVASNDDAEHLTERLSSRVAFRVSAGRTYRIAVDGSYGHTGMIRLGWHRWNNQFSRSRRLAGRSGILTDTNAGADKERGEPRHAGQSGGASIWYRWVAPSDGTYAFRTAGSNFDTLLAVYSGSEVSSLNRVASNDNSGGGLQSAVSFGAVAGHEYRVAVDGYQAQEGFIALSWQRRR